MSLNVRSTASNVSLFTIGASSQIITLAAIINFAAREFLGILQVDVSSIFKGIFNLECAVRPFCKSKEAFVKKLIIKHEKGMKYLFTYS